MGAFMFVMQQAPSIDSVFPKSVGGWVAMIAGLIAVFFLVYDRLRGSGKLDADLSNRVAEMSRKQDRTDHNVCGIEGNVKVLDQKVSEVSYEVRGIDGQNGVKGTAKNNAAEIVAIKKRLSAMDVLAALFNADREDDRRSSPTRRSLTDKLKNIVARPDDDDDEG